MDRTPRSICSAGALLGEGPVWIDDALWFVDIKGKLLHRFAPENGGLTSWNAPEQIGWILPMTDGGFMVGLESGLHRFDAVDGRFALLAAHEADRPGNRLNDATVDAAGRLWFGSMDDAEAADSGAIYRMDGLGIHRLIDGISITNGPAISPDGATLYHHDTLGGIVYASDLGPDGGLSNTRIFARITSSDGYPDGPTVDSAGCLWVGLYAGRGVLRYAPDGRLLEKVAFPVANVTKIAFGGPDLRTAYATTARKGLDAAALAAQPLAGNLFAFDVDVPGNPTPRIAWPT